MEEIWIWIWDMDVVVVVVQGSKPVTEWGEGKRAAVGEKKKVVPSLF